MSASKYEEVIDKLGDFGPYQKTVYYLLCLPSAMKALVIMNVIFVLSSPNYRCAIPNSNNDTYRIQSPYHLHHVNITIALEDGSYSECNVNNILSIAGVNNNSLNPKSLIVPNNSTPETRECHRWVYDQSEFSHTIITEYDLVCDQRAMRSHINMGFFAGSLVGSVVFGILADVIGRKKALLSCVMVQLVCGTGLYFVDSLVGVIILRSIQGMSGEMFALSASTGMELVGTKMRTFAGMMVEFFWTGGQALVLLTAYLTNSWRLLELIFGISALPLLIILLFLPESPRWLLEKKRYDEAEKIFKRIASSNKKPWSAEDMKGIDLDKTKKASILVLFKTRSLIITSTIIFYNWFAINFLYYGITLSLDNLSGNIYTNFLLNFILEGVAFIVCYFLLTRLGRKTIHAVCMMLGSIACVMVVFPVLYGTDDDRWSITFLALTGRMCASACYSILYIVTVELFPTNVRNSALGLCALFENAAGMVSPYIADLGIIYGGPLKEALPLLVFGAVSFLAGASSLVLPETRNKPLVEMDGIIEMKESKNASRQNQTNGNGNRL